LFSFVVLGLVSSVGFYAKRLAKITYLKWHIFVEWDVEP